MKIEVSKSVAKSILAMNDGREVSRKKVGTGQRWNKVTSVDECKDGYIFQADTLVNEADAREFVSIDERYRRLEKSLKDFKTKLNIDANCFRSATDETTYSITVADKTVRSSTSNRLSLVSANVAKDTLKNIFDDVFTLKPAEYTVTEKMRDAVIQILNGTLLEMEPDEYIDACGIAISDDVKAQLTGSVKQNAYVLKEILGCDWEAALLWSKDLHSCEQYKMLKNMAQLQGMTVDTLINCIRTCVDLTVQDRVTIITKKE